LQISTSCLMIVLIVTPTKNIENYLSQTIHSVVSQVGNFELYYHIQDSQSSDSTIQIIKRWEEVLTSPQGFYEPCSRISFSWSSEKDTGMYDAINRGFETLLVNWPDISKSSPEEVVMTWINGDDILTQGSVQTAISIFKETMFQWLTGIPSHIRDDGAIIETRDSPCCYSRDLLVRGLHDGRSFDFVQQEGTFWRKSLWQLAGPLNSSLKLAGDWDLWRRFSAYSDLVTVRGILGLYRRRSDQLSAQMGSYYEEIESIINSIDLTYDKDQEDHLKENYFGTVVRRYGDAQNWLISKEKVVPINTESDVKKLEDELDKARTKLRKCQANLQELETDLDAVKNELRIALSTIEAMESTRIWKLRKYFIDTKNSLGL
jgi:hypothetical protein